VEPPRLQLTPLRRRWNLKPSSELWKQPVRRLPSGLQLLLRLQSLWSPSASWESARGSGTAKQIPSPRPLKNAAKTIAA